MRRIIALLLCIAMTLTSCAPAASTVSSVSVADSISSTASSKKENALSVSNTVTNTTESSLPQFMGLDDADLTAYVEDTVYAELVATLDPALYYVEEVSSVYISKEYLDELDYNSKSNVFFGYTLKELDEQFKGTRYVFTLGDDYQTVVQPLEKLQDDTYEEVIKNVAIGTGVILVCATVALVTKNPASAATAGNAVKIIFAASSSGAKAATLMATSSAGIGGVTAALVEEYSTQDAESSLKAGILSASEGFKWGAISGAVCGITNGIRQVGDIRYFAEGTEQAKKYSQGVKFTKDSQGNLYPRFEKWAKATAKFDTPTLEAATNHIGLSGNYYWDAKLANAQCGFKSTPAGYVWHHVEDMKTMILIPQDLHSIAFGGMPHTGGASLIKAFLNL